MMKKIIIIVTIVASLLLCSCASNKNNKDVDNIDDLFPGMELTDDEKEFVLAVQTLDFEEQIGSDRQIIYTCSDESKGYPSQISFAFKYGKKYALWGLSMELWNGDFELDDNQVVLFSNPDLTDPQEKIVFDIVDGNKLAFNADLSSEDVEYELVIISPGESVPDLNGMLFEPDVKESMQYNFDWFSES